MGHHTLKVIDNGTKKGTAIPPMLKWICTRYEKALLNLNLEKIQ